MRRPGERRAVAARRSRSPAAGAGFRAPFRWDGDVCRVVDQRRLPDVLVDLEVRGGGDGVAAVRDEAVVGSPAQAQLAAVTLALVAGKTTTHRPFARRATIRGAANAFRTTRPGSAAIARCRGADARGRGAPGHRRHGRDDGGRAARRGRPDPGRGDRRARAWWLARQRAHGAGGARGRSRRPRCACSRSGAPGRWAAASAGRRCRRSSPRITRAAGRGAGRRDAARVRGSRIAAWELREAGVRARRGHRCGRPRPDRRGRGRRRARGRRSGCRQRRRGRGGRDLPVGARGVRGRRPVPRLCPDDRRSTPPSTMAAAAPIEERPAGRGPDRRRHPRRHPRARRRGTRPRT